LPIKRLTKDLAEMLRTRKSVGLELCQPPVTPARGDLVGGRLAAVAVRAGDQMRFRHVSAAPIAPDRINEFGWAPDVTTLTISLRIVIPEELAKSRIESGQRTPATTGDDAWTDLKGPSNHDANRNGPAGEDHERNAPRRSPRSARSRGRAL